MKLWTEHLASLWCVGVPPARGDMDGEVPDAHCAHPGRPWYLEAARRCGSVWRLPPRPVQSLH